MEQDGFKSSLNYFESYDECLEYLENITVDLFSKNVQRGKMINSKYVIFERL